MPQSPAEASRPPARTFGERVERARTRAGLTRAVVGGLVNRSAEWVKAVEKGRIGMPRLPLLLRLADVLGVDDLAELTGDERLSKTTYAKQAHPALSAVKAALTDYHFGSADEEPESTSELRARVAEAWRMWHADGDHRTRVATVLPDLLADLQYAARHYEGNDRRRVLVALAETYHIAQLYLSFQPASELITLSGDRSMTAAQAADDPYAIAGAAWYMNHVFRDAGERHEARVDLAMRASDLLRRDRGAEDLARWGLLQLAAALSYAKVGKRGDAERFWNRADRAAKQLGDAYSHPYLIFGRGMVDAYAITMESDLVSGGSAVEAAGNVDLSRAAMPSATRRAFHLAESARAYSMEREPLAVVHLLKQAYTESAETLTYNLFARSAVAELSASSNRLVRGEAEYLRQKMHLPATA
ncbi:Helix-turn-helix domain-containing protein [Streptomyces aidingensis]|uniref:Helix-turn-helix domain-containing protein n=2 Tax=Streptomyces aidingensis TaxID=910347 RepID=A0A1I1K1Y7_9ACTN|nr:Helix-turn-helix domain-containing protein [Streptomyces aidingensis]